MIDVGLAWLLMAVGDVPGGLVKATVLGWARGVLVKSFLGHFDIDAVKAQLSEIVAWKVQNPHISPKECQAMWRMVERTKAPV